MSLKYFHRTVVNLSICERQVDSHGYRFTYSVKFQELSPQIQEYVKAKACVHTWGGDDSRHEYYAFAQEMKDGSEDTIWMRFSNAADDRELIVYM